MLELDGYHVIAADSGKSGLELAKESLPGIIICDIKMSGIDGYEVISELRKDEKTARIPIIVLTALAQEKEIEAGLALGIKAYIRKPFSEEELTQCISSCFHGQMCGPLTFD